ncbi:lipopolysaccharide kinase InaA family protein [Methylophaga sp.]|uniref:lipopolysaccharide kinase InaA family protein n=1 Tax=Methylophaga sp. TaxID=2024840 RepID=UPI003F6A2FE4
MRFTRTIWHIDPDIAATQVGKRLGRLEQVFELDSEIVSEDNHGDVLKIETDGQSFFVKRFFDATGIRSWLGLSRLRIEARNQQRFTAMGLNAAAVAGYGEEYFFSRTLRGVLITRGIENSLSLEDVANKHTELLDDRAWLDNVMQQVADMTVLLHQNQICHNDLFWRNLLLENCVSKPKLFLIDCPSGCFWPKLFLKRRIVKDIASLDKHAILYLSRSQRLRFIKKYLRTARLSKVEKEFVRGVLQYPERRQKRKHRQKRLGLRN